MLSLTETLCPDFQFRTCWDEPVLPGYHVMIGENRGPTYEVVSVSGTMAWVRPLVNGQEGLVPTDRLRPAHLPIP